MVVLTAAPFHVVAVLDEEKSVPESAQSYRAPSQYAVAGWTVSKWKMADLSRAQRIHCRVKIDRLERK